MYVPQNYYNISPLQSSLGGPCLRIITATPENRPDSENLRPAIRAQSNRYRFAAPSSASRFALRNSANGRGGVPVSCKTVSSAVSKAPSRIVASNAARFLATGVGMPAAINPLSRSSSVAWISSIDISNTSFTKETTSLAESASGPLIFKRPSSSAPVSAAAANRDYGASATKAAVISNAYPREHPDKAVSVRGQSGL